MPAQVIPRTKKQSDIIHGLVARLNTVTKKNWYRKELSIRYGVRTSKDLTVEEAKDFIEILTNRAISLGVWKSSYDYRKEKERKGMATDKQINMIKAMYTEIHPLYVEISVIKGKSFEGDRDKALRKLLYRTMKIESLKWLKKEKVKDFVQVLVSINMQNINTLEVLKNKKEAMVING